MRAATVVCTIGTTPSPIIQHLEVKKERGRLVTDSDMRLNGFRNVWAVGDCAYITNAFDDKPAPTTGQFAEQGRASSSREHCKSTSRPANSPVLFQAARPALLHRRASCGRRNVFGISVSRAFWRGLCGGEFTFLEIAQLGSSDAELAPTGPGT